MKNGKIPQKQIEYALKELPYILKTYINYEDIYDGYYHLLKDIFLYPDAWCYAVWSKRGPGKTYSVLWLAYYCRFKFIYMKRTDDDVDLILRSDTDFDASPYYPLKRDKHIKVVGVRIANGIGSFNIANDEGEPTEQILCYVLSFNKVQKYKGFNFDSEFIVFDEFIPQLGERIRKSEGENLLDLYRTVERDRLKRGKKPIKLILFANAEEISTPVTNILEIVDDMMELNASGQSHLYLKERQIVLHHITDKEVPLEENEMQGIYIGMKNTLWWKKSFGGEFTHNDFSNVLKWSIKRSVPVVHIRYKTYDYYVYFNEEKDRYFMTYTKGQAAEFYDLNTENAQKRFYEDYIIDLQDYCIHEKMKFEKYSMYDLIINYRKFFNIT